MIAAAAKNKVSVQVGSQGRSTGDAYAAATYLRNGMIGKVARSPAGTTATPWAGPIPTAAAARVGLGPVARPDAWRPYNRCYCPGSFRWFLESGGGQIRDRGAHVMSVRCT